MRLYLVKYRYKLSMLVDRENSYWFLLLLFISVRFLSQRSPEDSSPGISSLKCRCLNSVWHGWPNETQVSIFSPILNIWQDKVVDVKILSSVEPTNASCLQIEYGPGPWLWSLLNSMRLLTETLSRPFNSCFALVYRVSVCCLPIISVFVIAGKLSWKR